MYIHAALCRVLGGSGLQIRNIEVKLIQNAKLDARIDSEKSRVVMSKAPPSVYQQVG